MLIVRNLTHKINSVDTLFENLSFSIGNNEKVGLVGKNGIGKSVLLSLIVGKIQLYNGDIIKNELNISYFPQKFNELNFNTVADVFGLEKQVISLRKVDANEADVEDYENLDGNWDCADKISEKMKFFKLNFDLLRDFKTLSGGEKVKLILCSILNKNSNFLILDEPTNNMDLESRKTFYDFIKNWQNGILLVSHDRELLNLMDKVFELRRIGMKDTKLFIYGGNYDYWKKQKDFEEEALINDFTNSINKEKVKKQEAIRTVKRLKTGFSKAGRIASDGSIKAARTLQEMNREKSALRQLSNSKKRVIECDDNIKEIQDKMDLSNKIYFKFPESKFVNKILISIEDLIFFYGKKQIFKNFSLEIYGGDRISINGKNGSGKTTLLKIISGNISDFRGKVRINTQNVVCLDQNCDFLNLEKTILENMRICNADLTEGKCRNILAEFLFRTDDVYKKIKDLSGGEKLRVALACVLAKENIPELILLDEPTNNMDLDSIEVLENVLNSYNGAILVISHDEDFKSNIKVNKTISLSSFNFVN